MDAAGRAIDALEQVASKAHEVRLRPALGHDDAAPSALGFDRHEQIAGAPTHIFVVLSRWTARPHRQCDTAVGEQLRALLIQAHERFRASVRSGIQGQQIVHALPVFLGQCPDTPHQPPPGFEAVFLAAGECSRG